MLFKPQEPDSSPEAQDPGTCTMEGVPADLDPGEPKAIDLVPEAFKPGNLPTTIKNAHRVYNATKAVYEFLATIPINVNGPADDGSVTAKIQKMKDLADGGDGVWNDTGIDAYWAWTSGLTGTTGTDLSLSGNVPLGAKENLRAYLTNTATNDEPHIGAMMASMKPTS